MLNDILVKMDYDEGYASIKTYDRKHHGSNRFLFAELLLERVIKNDDAFRSFFDTDCGHYVEIWKENDSVIFRFAWLSPYGDDYVRGYTQCVFLPEKVIVELLESHAPIRYLCKPTPRSSRIEASRARQTIRTILMDKVARNAFRKALRDSFQWGADETITLMDDGGKDFYFVTASGFPKNGGLILHRGTHNGHPCVFYSIHT